MIYRVGFGNKIKKDIWAGKFQCQNCSKISNFYLYKVKLCGYMFYIPIVSKTMQRLLVCDTCKAYRELSRVKYNDIKRTQKNKIKEGEVPYDVIMKEFNPKELKFGRKILYLVLACMNGFLWIVGAIGMGIDIPVWDASVPIGIFCMFLIGLLPLVPAIYTVIFTSQKKKLYDKVAVYK